MKTQGKMPLAKKYIQLLLDNQLTPVGLEVLILLLVRRNMLM